MRLEEMRVCTRVFVIPQIHVCANEYVRNERLYVFLRIEFIFLHGVCVLTLQLAYHMLHALFISIKIIKK